MYPATPNLHATEHELLTSPDGQGWTSLRTEDAPAQQQAQAEIATSGLVVVGGVPVQIAPSTPSDSGANRLSNVLLVIAAASLLIGIGLLLRARGTERETGKRPRVRGSDRGVPDDPGALPVSRRRRRAAGTG